MNVILLKLITGEEIIATCDRESPFGFNLSRVRKIVQFPAPAANGVQWPISLMPYWAGASVDEKMDVGRELIALTAQPTSAMEQAYLQTVSGIQIAHA